MPNEDEGVNDEPVAEAPEHNDEGVNSQVATEEQEQGEGVSDKEMNFREVTSRLKNTESDLQAHKQLVQQLYAQLNSNPQGAKHSQPEEDPLSFLGEKEGYESLTVEEGKKLFGAIDAKIKGVKTASKRQSIQDKYGDYQTLIAKYENEVPTAIAEAISTSKDLEAAIVACMNTPSYKRDHAEKNVHPDAKKALTNADKPKSSAGVGASGTVSKFSAFMNKSRQERLAEARKIARGA